MINNSNTRNCKPCLVVYHEFDKKQNIFLESRVCLVQLLSFLIKCMFIHKLLQHDQRHISDIYSLRSLIVVYNDAREIVIVFRVCTMPSKEMYLPLHGLFFFSIQSELAKPHLIHPKLSTSKYYIDCNGHVNFPTN